MAAVPHPQRLRQTLKRHLAWQYLSLKARQEGIDPASLTRVKGFLRNKFGQLASKRTTTGQMLSGFFPGLTPTPVYDPAQFEWVRTLEEAAPAIQAEFLALRERGQFKPHPQNLADTGAWNTYFLYSNGVRFDEHCAACPTTAEVMNELPGAGTAGGVYFSVMTPGTHVQPHCGPVNTKIRCHLGLVVPESSVIRVGSERLNWRELGCIVFDDSFEHEVWNPDAERAVLIIDLWHPDLTPEEQWAVRRIAQMSTRNRGYRRDIRKRR